MSDAPITIRRGDVWHLRTNNQVIARHVRSVACGVVYYLYGGEMRNCYIDTFRSWAKGATLEFADDWTDREAQKANTNV